MALYIRDREVDALAERLQAMTNAPTKTEAVRRALESEIERKKSEIPLKERLQRIRAEARTKGLLPNPDFDQKAFFDDMWGEN
ncbi:type II toxin-antitoxin system VapB family antitoxin [Rhizobium sp. TH2]|uniref:type II toxin-antitoxin system VapB family antitoxin n=1 Tax=Rhizobium sp. TH2 TaxID=2775403 RepID=UPI002157BFA4|nr:type II toxin-antitoxin system VapB family antitoxin [Rhizobium sp. TH2]UVC10646.1 type II toxin-antitoxin system VapB family antitoxin [Rhizobium sp. TH2]